MLGALPNIAIFAMDGYVRVVPDIPSRVRELISTRGLNQRDFAAGIGMDDSKLSKSLGGARRFSSLDLARIAEAYDVTVDWLVTGEEPALAVAARTAGGTATVAVEIAERYARMRTDIAALGYQQPWNWSTSNLAGSSDGRLLARAAREAVDAVDTADDLPTRVEQAFGIDVTVADLGAQFDGLAVSSPEVKLIVLAVTHVPARQRFTLAHELGHILAGDDQVLHLDEDVFARTHAREPSEMRANAFAAEFLMPQHLLRSKVDAGMTMEGFAELATELFVTPSALAYQLQRLRLIDAGTCDQWKTITAAKAAQMSGRSDEFALRSAESATTRFPGLLIRDTYAAYQSGATTLRPYAELLGADIDVLRESLEAKEGDGSRR